MRPQLRPKQRQKSKVPEGAGDGCGGTHSDNGDGNEGDTDRNCSEGGNQSGGSDNSSSTTSGRLPIQRHSRRVKPGPAASSQHSVSEFRFHYVFPCGSNSHIDSSTSPPVKLHSCEILSAFNQTYIPGIGIVCHDHSHTQIITIGQWKVHILNLHSKKIPAIGQMRKQMVDEMHTHVSTSHALDPNIDIALSSHISHSLPFPKTPPKLFHHCPYNGCGDFWCAVSNQHNQLINQHVDKKHGPRHRRESYPCHYVQKVLLYGTKPVFHSFILPKDWNGDTNFPHPPKGPTKRAHAVSPSTATFIMEAGWPEYSKRLHASPKDLYCLVKKPSLRLVKSTRTRMERYIEAGLLLLHQLNFHYLHSIIAYTFRKHSDLRRVLIGR
jgi:hypothetical protein